VPIGRKEASGEICEKGLFFFIFIFIHIFFTDSATEVTRGWILTHNGSKHALWRKEVHFVVHTMADNILGCKFLQNRHKCLFVGTF